MNAFDMVPEWEQTKLICMMTAEGDYATFRRLYYEEDFADVWEALGLQRAASWTPPPIKEDPKPR